VIECRDEYETEYVAIGGLNVSAGASVSKCVRKLEYLPLSGLKIIML
jgi:hypothetical protein